MPLPSPARLRAGRALLAAAAVPALLLTATTATAATAESAADSASGPETHRIATTTFGSDLKIALTAHRSGEYEAIVELIAFRHGKGGWRPVDRAPVGDTWFWYPLTGKGAVCDLALSDRPDDEPSATVSLVLTPSLGCSESITVPIDA
ncbi:hypothetical protein [Nocardiopsis suaedae]|uniref:Secreted protein n=1 Tax=Nocardiopsis suaedae TaxID=3018444 RepID=A0ABT4TRH7_9ACTN|nr:hypothetical protein [Nocardiopsis suaedae]MDA2806869.1 hypothetical protein [Nocardiopsis suaedae]